MSAFDLIAKAAKGAKKAAPFFSKADVVLDELPRGKGLGNEFLNELVKKGAKPTELKERGIEKALKDKPKMTKAEVQKIFEEKAPPKVTEKVLISDAPDYDEFLEAKAQEIYGVDWFDLRKEEKKALEKMFGDLPLTQYDKFKTPGGENYREILLKLPAFDDKRLMELEAQIRREEASYVQPMQHQWFRDKVAEVQRLKEEKAAAGAPYVSSHYRNDPNLLAHIRVQDFQSPTKGFAVVNTRSGNKSPVFQTMEEAQAYMAQMPESLRGMLRIDEAVGKPKKVLLVDEIQSDWHQEGRKGGYRSGSEQKQINSLADEYNNLTLRRRNLIREAEETKNAGPAFLSMMDEIGEITPRLAELEQQMDVLRKTADAGVPDAPFKKNWHELAMKRVLDYAAENGYDTVAITPGAEQAKRYDLSKHVNELFYKKNPDGTYSITAQGKDLGDMIEETLPADKLQNFVGKELADKIIGGQGKSIEVEGPYDYVTGKSSKEQVQSLSGLDLQVGGEGMKGFYDKILPDYLNNYGKQYGAGVGEIELKKPLETAWSIEQLYKDTGVTPEQWQAMSQSGRAALRDQHFSDFQKQKNFQSFGTFHGFDITPQMREEIKTKGQPMYGKVAMPALEGMAGGTGAAAAGSQIFDGDNEQTVQNPVHFTENPDAMLLELMQRN